MFELFKTFLPTNKKEASLPNDDQIWGVGGGYTTNFPTTPMGYLNSFQTVEYIAISIRILADDISSAKWVLKNKAGEHIEDDNITNLFRKPNSDMYWSQFIQQIVIHLLLDGNFFIVPDITNAYDSFKKLPTELILLNPSRVQVYSVTDRIIRDTTQINSKTGRYNYDWDGQQVNKTPDEIYHGKRIGPHNTIRGMGKISENNKLLNYPRLQTILTEQFIENGAKIDYMAIPEDKLGTVEYERWKKQINQQTRGFTNFFKMFIAPFKMTMQKMNVSHDDIQASEQRQLNRDDITNYMFQIPAARLAVSEKSKQNTTGDEMRNYHENVLPGYWKPIENVINSILWRYRPDIEFGLVPHKWIDLEQQAKIGGILKQEGSINGNEHRELVDISRDDSNDHLNTYYIPANLLPAGDESRPDPEAGNPKPKKKKSCEITHDVKANPAPVKMLRFHDMTQRLRSKLEKRFTKELHKMYKDMERRVLAGLDKDIKPDTKAAEINDVFDLITEEGIGLKVGKNMFTSFLVQAIGQHNDYFGSKVDTSTRNPNFTLVVEKLAKNYVSTTLDTNREDLKKLLSDALETGESMHEIKERIKEYFDVYTNPEHDWKAIRIARTEISHVYDQAAKMSFQELGVKWFQVVGCSDAHIGYDCDVDGSKGTYPLSHVDQLRFHPNHLGTIVPILED